MAIDKLSPLADGISKLADAFEHAVQVGYRLWDGGKRRQEDERLKTIHQQLRGLFIGQSGLLAQWPELKAPPSEPEWNYLQKQMLGVADQIARVLESLAAYNGEYARVESTAFLDLARVGAQRGAVLATAARLDRPQTQAQISQINALRTSYSGLLDRFQHLIGVMGRYLALPSR